METGIQAVRAGRSRGGMWQLCDVYYNRGSGWTQFGGKGVRVGLEWNQRAVGTDISNL